MSRRPPGQDSPRLDTRRSADFAAELRTRARAWIPGWELDDGVGDFGRALLDIAARFNAEVAERLDNAGDKMRRGFLDWLAVRGEAARPARMPVAFRLADAATNAVLAEAPVRLQVDAGGTPVVFETERDVRIVPGRVEALVAVDIANDAYYVAPSGVLSLDPLEPAPARWQPRSYVSAGTTTFQLDPEGGLAEGTVIDAAGRQYRVVAVEKDLVTISPPLDTDLTQDVVVTKADRLTPFDAVRRNWQEHALYLGDAELLNIEAAATIEVMGANALRTGVAWEYLGQGRRERRGRVAIARPGCAAAAQRRRLPEEGKGRGRGQRDRRPKRPLDSRPSRVVRGEYHRRRVHAAPQQRRLRECDRCRVPEGRHLRVASFRGHGQHDAAGAREHVLPARA